MEPKTSILLILGSVLFLVAAFMPVTRVFIEKDAAVQLQLISKLQMQWNWGHVMFIIGSLLSAFALVFVVLPYDGTGLRWLVYAGAGCMVIGAILWSWHCTERLTNPAAFVQGEHTPYLFVIYSVLSQAALVFFGLYLMQTELVSWIPWMLVISGALFFVLMILFGDMPPFVYYLITLIMGISIYLK